MKCSSVQKELLAWKIDHKGAGVPEYLKSHLETCPACRKEWSAIQGWVQALQPQEEAWTPEEGFFDRLVEQAMREKRRASLTDSTRQELALDSFGVFSLFHRRISWMVPALALFLVVLVPAGLWIQKSFHTIGEIQYTSGHVIAMADTLLDTRRGESIPRNTTVQTPQYAKGIVQLKNGVEICVEQQSRLTLLDPRTVRMDRGTAYFDIPPQEKSFQVILPSGEVQVLGTAFAISIAEDGSVVTVTRGKVRVSSGARAIQVDAGKEGVVRPSGRPEIREAQRLAQTMRWVSQIREQRNQEELRYYYPSLAVPTPLEGAR
ncbi:MAG: FecR domain-containing protein [bacterium]